MGKLLGLFACATLGAAALWWTNSGKVAMTATEPPGSSASSPTGRHQTARDFLDAGRNYYRTGQFAEAKLAFEEAVLAPGLMTPAEREELGRFLTDPKLISATNLNRTPYEAQYQPQPYARSQQTADESFRRPVDDLMRQAFATYRAGNVRDAIRHAEAAERMARQMHVRFDAGEMTPSDFLAKVKAAPEGTQIDLVAGVRGQSPDGVTTANATSPWDQPPSSDATTMRSPKEHATELLQLAEAAIAAGRYEEARQAALKARSLNVTYTLLELSPQIVLDRVDALTGSTTIVRNGAPAAANNPGFSRQVAASAEASRKQSQELMNRAEAAIEAGRFDEAEQLLDQAAEMKATYGVFDRRPSVVRNDLEQTRIAQQNPSRFAPTAVAQNDTRMEQARTTLRSAREDLRAGRYDLAEQKAASVRAMNLTYGPLDDRPANILADVARLRTPAGTGGTATSVADVSQQRDELNRRAVTLVAQARQAMNAGDYQAAQRLATQAQQLDAPYGLTDDRPGYILQDLAALQRRPQPGTDSNVVQTAGTGNPATAPRPATPTRDLFADPEPNDAADPFATPQGETVVAAPVFDPVVTSGMSGDELYTQGLQLLRAGDRQGAYDAFLAAHQSGERLSGPRQQRLQDFLRELHPRRSAIRQVSGETAPTPMLVGNPADAASPIELARREDALKFDRLRGEVLNAIIRADRLQEEHPDQALEVIDRAMTSVETADLDTKTVQPLHRQLQRKREKVNADLEMRQPIVDLKARNEEIEASLEQDLRTRIRIEQELADLVEEYNTLMRDRRYAEAEVLAKQAKQLDPDNPVTVALVLKAQLARRIDTGEQIASAKEQGFVDVMQDVDRSSIPFSGEIAFPDAREWAELTARRGKYGTDNRIRTEMEKQIEKSLQARVNLHFDNEPLAVMVRHIAAVADVNVVLDDLGLADTGATSDHPVSINVDGIKLKSALNLMLKPLGLTYMIQDEVLMITSPLREQGDLMVTTYPVADLVVPIPNFVQPRRFGEASLTPTAGGGQMSVSPFGGGQIPGQAMAQVGPFGGNTNPLADPNFNPVTGQGPDANLAGGGAAVDYDTLMDLIINTVEPGSWLEMGGAGTVRPYNTTLSLVIRQTQRVHEEIADLLKQLRRLQDLQVTVEVRFVTVTDSFFEQIGVDFDFNVQDTVGGPPGLPPFGAVDPTPGDNDPGDGAPFDDPIDLALDSRDSWHRPTVIGLGPNGEFTPDLDVQFRQGSFDVGVPNFVNNPPLNAGMNVGLAILSDIEAFFFIRAVQTDDRSNLLFAPKVTLFNGQQASVQNTVQRPFVTSLIPTVGFFSVGFTPQITVVAEGIFLNVQAVISADRRFVRLTVSPNFSNITDVEEFSFLSGGGGGAGGVIGGAGGGAGGGGFGGGGQFGAGGGGFGGGQFGGAGGGALGFGGIGGGQVGQTGQGGQGGQAGQQGGGGTTITVQQPVVEIVNVATTVSVPDGGTVLLGGIKRLREGRNMAGVPILNKIPYVSRLFKNTGVARDTESLMLMVTPRIIIQEEEEELLLGTNPL